MQNCSSRNIGRNASATIMPVSAGYPAGGTLVPNNTGSAKIGAGRISTRADGNPTDNNRRANGGLSFVRIRIKVTALAALLEARYIPRNIAANSASKSDYRRLWNTNGLKGNYTRIGTP